MARKRPKRNTFSARDWMEILSAYVKYYSATPVGERGSGYAIAGAVREAYADAYAIAGEVAGSRIYEAEFVALDDGGVDSFCSCPVSFECKHTYALAVRMLAEGCRRGLLRLDDVKDLLPARWVQSGLVVPPLRGESLTLFFGSEPEPARQSMPALELNPNWWREFIVCDDGWARQELLRLSLAARIATLPLHLVTAAVGHAGKDGNRVEMLRKFRDQARHYRSYYQYSGMPADPALDAFLESPEAGAAFQSEEQRLVAGSFLAWIDQQAREVQRPVLEQLEVQWTLTPIVGRLSQAAYSVLWSGVTRQRSPRTHQALEQLSREVRSGKRALAGAGERFLQWLLGRPCEVLSVPDNSKSSVFKAFDLHEWWRLWGNANLLHWQNGLPLEIAEGHAELRLHAGADGRVRWAAALHPAAGDAELRPLRELSLVLDDACYGQSPSTRNFGSLFIHEDGRLTPIRTGDLPLTTLYQISVMEEVPIDALRAQGRGDVVRRILARTGTGLLTQLVDEIPVRARVELRLNAAVLGLRVDAKASEGRGFTYHPGNGWTLVAAPVESKLSETTSEAPLEPASDEDHSPDLPAAGESSPVAVALAPRQEDVAPLEVWLQAAREQLRVFNGEVTHSGIHYKLAQADFARIHAWWHQRPASVDYFANSAFLSLVRPKSLSSLQIHVEPSGVNFLEVSVDWAEEMAAISLEDVESALSAYEGGLVHLPSGLYRRDDLEQYRQQLGMLASLGIAPQPGKQRLHAMHLAGEGAAEFLQRAEESPALEQLRLRAQELVQQFKGVPNVPLPAAAKKILRPYQRQGVNFLCWACQTFGGALLADEMGLGKTLQVLTAISVLRRKTKAALPSLVVCPASVAHNWQREAAKFTPDLRVVVIERGLERRKILEDLSNYDLVVKNYTLTRMDAEILQQQEWLMVCVDEAQAIKNPAAAISQTVKQLQARFRIALTGTPIENRLSDLWSIIDFTTPGYLPARDALEDRAKQLNLSLAFKVLRAQLRPVLLRRLKVDVAPELPPRIEERRDCAMEPLQKKLYLSELKLARGLLEKNRDPRVVGPQRIQILAALTRLRQICCDPAVLGHEFAGSGKTTVLLETLAPLIESGEKVLVFSQFVRVLERIEARLREEGIRTYKLTGSTTGRQAVVDAFEADTEPAVFLISLKAGGTGLNLTSAAHVILFDPWWNPAIEAQAIDRTHRIGQLRSVLAFRFVAEGTVEERILELQEKKRDLVKNVFEADSFNRALMREDFEFLLADK